MKKTTPINSTFVPARPFLNWPVITNPVDWQGNVAVLGVSRCESYPGEPVPNDQASAPDAIRQQSFQFCDGQHHWDFDISCSLAQLTAVKPMDCGNINYVGNDYLNFAQWQTAIMKELWKKDVQVFTLGGDHGITIPNLQALEVLQEQVHIVHIDAHLDWRDEVKGVKNGYSSPLFRASEMPWVSGMTQIGLRGTGSARHQEVEKAEAWGADLITAAQVHAQGVEKVLERLPKDKHVYLTIDADGLDPSHMPAVLGPSPGGLYTEQVKAIVQNVAKNNKLVGMDVVEIAPSVDFANNISCITAGRLIINAIGASWLDKSVQPSG